MHCRGNNQRLRKEVRSFSCNSMKKFFEIDKALIIISYGRIIVIMKYQHINVHIFHIKSIETPVTLANIKIEDGKMHEFNLHSFEIRSRWMIIFCVQTEVVAIIYVLFTLFCLRANKRFFVMTGSAFSKCLA